MGKRKHIKDKVSYISEKMGEKNTVKGLPFPPTPWMKVYTILDYVPVCDHYQVRLSVSHILVECPTYSVSHNQFYPSLTSMPPCERLSFLLSESPTFSSTLHIFESVGSSV